MLDYAGGVTFSDSVLTQDTWGSRELFFFNILKYTGCLRKMLFIKHVFSLKHSIFDRRFEKHRQNRKRRQKVILLTSKIYSWIICLSENSIENINILYFQRRLPLFDHSMRTRKYKKIIGFFSLSLLYVPSTSFLLLKISYGSLKPNTELTKLHKTKIDMASNYPFTLPKWHISKFNWKTINLRDNDPHFNRTCILRKW